MTIEEFYQLKVGDNVLYNGQILKINFIYFNTQHDCFDISARNKETDEKHFFCSDYSREKILTELTKL